MKKTDTYQKSCMRTGILMILLSLIFSSCVVNEEWEKYYEDVPEKVNKDVNTILASEQNYSLFYEQLVKYDYVDFLSQDQYFTVFVPVNSAFESGTNYSDEEWKRIIDFHILYNRLFSHDFRNINLMSKAGKYLELRSGDNDEFLISGSTINMEQVDKNCRNGVIHEIDRLLLPKPNVHEYIMALDTSYSILQDFINSMDVRFIDYDKSERIGVDDDGNTIYDTVWREENYFLDNIAGLDKEDETFTAFIPSNSDIRKALADVAEYFGDIDELEEDTYNQLLFITFSGSFTRNSYLLSELPDSMISVSGKKIDKKLLNFKANDLPVSNGIIHLLSEMTLPKNYFVVPIIIEADRKKNRVVSNTIYPIEQLSDTRATNGSYVYYDCKFVGDYIEFTVEMVLKTTYWFIWTGPKQGPSHYQVSVKDEETGQFIPIGEPVNNWTKGNFNPVVSGTYTFRKFGTKTVRMTIVDELPLVGYNSIYLDYIKLVPDEIYNK